MPTIDRDEEFDRFLAQSLAPPTRLPDSRFVGRVSQQILLEQLRRRSRAQMVERLGIDLLSVIAVGCGLVAAGAGSDFADSAGNVPAVVLLGMVLLFGFWVAIVSRPTLRKMA